MDYQDPLERFAHIDAPPADGSVPADTGVELITGNDNCGAPNIFSGDGSVRSGSASDDD